MTAPEQDQEQEQNRRPKQHPADIGDLLAPYTLGALEPDDVVRVERHLAHCDGCAAEVAAARRAISLLPFLARAAAPPPDAKAALFARIAQADGARRAPAPSLAAALAMPTLPSSRPVAASAAGSGATDAGPVRRWGTLARRVTRPNAPANPLAWPVVATMVAVPLVLALAVVSGWAMTLHGKLDNANSKLSAFTARETAMNALFADQDGTVYTYELTGGPAAPQAVGKLYADPNKSVATLTVRNLSHTKSNTLYQIWVEKNGRMVRAGQLTVDSNGNGATTLQMSGPFAEYQSVHVTAQPLTAGTTYSAAVLQKRDALSTDIEPRVGAPSNVTGP